MNGRGDGDGGKLVDQAVRVGQNAVGDRCGEFVGRAGNRVDAGVAAQGVVLGVERDQAEAAGSVSLLIVQHLQHQQQQVVGGEKQRIVPRLIGNFHRLPDVALKASFAEIDAVAVPFRLKIQPQPGALPGDDKELAEKEARINEIRRNWLYYKFRDELKKQDPSLAADSLENELHARASILVEDTLAVLGPVVIPAERREIYKTIGGVPHLDGSVTIFGEVVEGLDIVEKISVVKTDKNDRPLHDVMIKSTKVFQK